MLKVFTIKFENNLESFNDSLLSNFLSDKEVIRWESRFFENKKVFYWTVVVEYMASSASKGILPAKKVEKKDEKYKEILTENDWPLFNRLRDWRVERGKEEIKCDGKYSNSKME